MKGDVQVVWELWSYGSLYDRMIVYSLRLQSGNYNGGLLPLAS